MNKLFLIFGIPGSGKTAKAKEICDLYHNSNIKIDHWEANIYFQNLENDSYDFNPLKLKEAHSWCQNQCKISMKNNNDVIISNTSLTPADRLPYINLAKQFNYEIIFIQADGNFKSIYNIPENTIKRMKQKFIPLTKDEVELAIINCKN